MLRDLLEKFGTSLPPLESPLVRDQIGEPVRLTLEESCECREGERSFMDERSGGADDFGHKLCEIHARGYGELTHLLGTHVAPATKLREEHLFAVQLAILEREKGGDTHKRNDEHDSSTYHII